MSFSSFLIFGSIWGEKDHFSLIYFKRGEIHHTWWGTNVIISWITDTFNFKQFNFSVIGLKLWKLVWFVIVVVLCVLKFLDQPLWKRFIEICTFRKTAKNQFIYPRPVISHHITNCGATGSSLKFRHFRPSES